MCSPDGAWGWAVPDSIAVPVGVQPISFDVHAVRGGSAGGARVDDGVIPQGMAGSAILEWFVTPPEPSAIVTDVQKELRGRT